MVPFLSLVYMTKGAATGTLAHVAIFLHVLISMKDDERLSGTPPIILSSPHYILGRLINNKSLAEFFFGTRCLGQQ
jgi:hypothetical protein